VIEHVFTAHELFSRDRQQQLSGLTVITLSPSLNFTIDIFRPHSQPQLQSTVWQNMNSPMFCIYVHLAIVAAAAV
jgi:hypothetical protein